MLKEKNFSFLNVLMVVIVMVFICDGGSYEVTNNVVGLVMNAVLIWFCLFLLCKLFERLLNDNDNDCENNKDPLCGNLLKGYKTREHRVRNLDTNEYVMNAQRREMFTFSTNFFVAGKDSVIDFMKPFKKGKYRLEEIRKDDEDFSNDVDLGFEFEIKDKPFVFIYVDYENSNYTIGKYKIEDF